MNIRLSLLLFTILAGILHAANPVAAPRTEVRFLTIGNSFAEDATRLLPDLAKAGGKQLIILRANIGGCSLEKHASILAAALKNPDDPAGKGYKGKPHPRTGEKRDYSLPEALAAEPWDLVSIQQLSDSSYKPNTFEPHAANLIAAIRRFAPSAEILIHQTWAWRQDAPKLTQEGIDSKKMYEGIRAAYAALSDRYKLRIMPVGDAFQLARAHPNWKFSGKDDSFDYTNPPAGKLPQEKGDLIVGWHWGKPAGSPAPKFTLDFKHANRDGQYLGAAVFYEILFNDSVLNVDYVPAKMTPENARILRQIAHQAVQNSRKNNPRRRPGSHRRCRIVLAKMPQAA